MMYGDEVVLTKDNAREVFGHMLSPDTVFTNSQCMVVEYHDCVKSPWYVLLTVLSQNKKIRELVDLTPIDGLNSIQLFEWYRNRKNRNFLLDIASYPESVIPYDELLEVLMNNRIFYLANTELNTVNIILTAVRTKTVKKVIIFNDKARDRDGKELEINGEISKHIAEDVANIFGNKNIVSFVNDDFSKIVDSVPPDSTYIISDFTKITTLDDKKRLNYSSLVLPNDFAYNYVFDDNNGLRTDTPIINFDYFAKNSIFKLNFFNASYKES